MSENEGRKSEGLIKDTYELILREMQTVLTLFYLLLVGIGMLFTHYKYDSFGINIFEYADIFDFLIAPFKDRLIIWVSFFTLLVPGTFIFIDRWWSRNYPNSYSKFNFGWDKKWWYDYYRYTAFIGLLIYFLFEGARGYGQFEASSISAAPVMEVIFSDETRTTGFEIGKTKEVLFLMVGDKVRIIPLASLVKEVRPLKQKSMKDVMELFDNVADEYASRYWSVDQYKGQIDLWLNAIPKGGRVLDLGCGPGNYADHALGKRPDLDWKGVDFSPAMIKIAKDSVPGADFSVGDVTDGSVFQGSWDGVMISFVTPYLDNDATKKMIKRAYRNLENRGVLYLASIVGEVDEVKAQPSSDGKSNSLLTYYRKVETYQRWLDRQGFEILKIEKKTVDYGNKSTDEAIILAQKSED